MENELEKGLLHPRDAKMKLAYEITDSFYGNDKAEQAQADFINKFQRNEAPESMDSFVIGPSTNCLDILIESGLVKSRSEGRSMITQKAVKLDGEVIQDWDANLKPGVLQVGKRKFIRLGKPD
jgi:tyrosyl-tRNA synthetase